MYASFLGIGWRRIRDAMFVCTVCGCNRAIMIMMITGSPHLLANALLLVAM